MFEEKIVGDVGECEAAHFISLFLGDFGHWFAWDRYKGYPHDETSKEHVHRRPPAQRSL
jgi:hypothetical protein